MWITTQIWYHRSWLMDISFYADWIRLDLIGGDWNMNFSWRFHILLGIRIPSDLLIFQRGWTSTSQFWIVGSCLFSESSEQVLTPPHEIHEVSHGVSHAESAGIKINIEAGDPTAIWCHLASDLWHPMMARHRSVHQCFWVSLLSLNSKTQILFSTAQLQSLSDSTWICTCNCQVFAVWFIYIWLVVWNIFIFPFSWEYHHPNWLTFFRGVQTTNHMYIYIYIYLILPDVSALFRVSWLLVDVFFGQLPGPGGTVSQWARGQHLAQGLWGESTVNQRDTTGKRGWFCSTSLWNSHEIHV